MKDDAADLESVQMYGLVLYRMGRRAEALPYLERVRQWVPSANADANYIIALCYMDAHRLDQARDAFARQFGMPANSASAYLLLANMLRQSKDSEAAAQQARKALQLSPSLPMAHFLLGELAMLETRIPEAIAEYSAERRVNPNYALVYDRLGDAYLRADKLDAAQQSLIRAIALDRNNTDSFIKMGKVLLARQDVQTAVMYLKVAEKMDPSHFMTHELLAQAYHRTGASDRD